MTNVRAVSIGGEVGYNGFCSGGTGRSRFSPMHFDYNPFGQGTLVNNRADVHVILVTPFSDRWGGDSVVLRVGGVGGAEHGKLTAIAIEGIFTCGAQHSNLRNRVRIDRFGEVEWAG